MDYTENVNHGIEWLDAHYPAWREAIDTDTLDLADPKNCVVGQLSHQQFCAFVAAHELSHRDQVHLGFEIPQALYPLTYPDLTAVWKRKLAPAA